MICVGYNVGVVDGSFVGFVVGETDEFWVNCDERVVGYAVGSYVGRSVGTFVLILCKSQNQNMLIRSIL